ncbi:Ctr copper transporter [Pyrenophora seminiperda CCB06]|uniref:Copper transport protein n=1 Tax=Pyrenophora seminiperda CCB06 TaxID=1302712 RepID=A0A3M7MIN1_9PLEO|nr:Ctr copper transporter [Pyrenophora seminiperda CCB06]
MNMNMPMATSATSAMPMSTAMSMSSMSMTFFTSTSTPLFALSWKPSTAGQYAGTCIFLIILSALFRALVAIRFNLFKVLAIIKDRRDEQGAYGYGRKCGMEQETRRWRADEAVWIAGADVVLAGVSYLLMIAVMTMNVGYFISVLAGIFLGSLMFGHFIAKSAAT